MVKKYRKYDAKKSRTAEPEKIGESIFILLKDMGYTRERIRLAALWENWMQVMGEEFCWIIPLGNKAGTLFLGVENAMEIQEITLQSPQILERVNLFMGMEYFSQLRVTLCVPGHEKE